MRPISRKVYSKITEKGITREDVLEILDRVNPQEIKKSFQDDCLFQSDKYFAKIILEELQRYRLIKREGNVYLKVEKEKGKRDKNKG